MRVTTVTKAVARQLAKKALRHGFFSDDAQELSGHQRCPCCRQNVGADLPREHWGKPDLRKRAALIKAIEGALIAHLTCEFDDETCPHTQCWPRHEVGAPVEPS